MLKKKLKHSGAEVMVAAERIFYKKYWRTNNELQTINEIVCIQYFALHLHAFAKQQKLYKKVH